ncbi:DUF5104 domain-containing protein [Ruminococcus sp. OM05-10BH]|nr:DUF5104 domain-containing protein [Ruminococcus sp. OM05-10BH]
MMYLERYCRKLVGVFMLNLLLALLTSGCTYKTDKAMEDQAKAKAESIMECIENKNPDGLVSLFSEYTMHSCNLQAEADELLGFVHGNIVSYGNVSVTYYQENIRKDDSGAEQYEIRIDDIKTDTSEQYEIVYDYYISQNPENDHNGINMLRIGNLAEYTSESGYSASGVKVMGKENDLT